VVYRRFGKRIFDILAASVALVLLFPLFVLVALVIHIDDLGPTFFRQCRIGRGGAPFTLVKFRSMPVGTPTLESSQAMRIYPTRVGRLLRRTNIDELPQLWNILLGQMSLVGPRPALSSQEDVIRLRLDSGALDVRPGLTGLAQINAYHGMSSSEKVRWDKAYANRITLWSDSMILIRTVGYLARRPPVY